MKPQNEQGVIVKFVELAQDTDWEIASIQTAFPDAIIQSRLTGETFTAEFEFRAGNFKIHGHDFMVCDVIICWENDWPHCPITVWELSDWQNRAVHSNVYTKRIRDMQERLNELSIIIDDLTRERDNLQKKLGSLSLTIKKLESRLAKGGHSNFRQYTAEEIVNAISARKNGHGRGRFRALFESPPGGDRSRSLLALADEILMAIDMGSIEE